ncbi:hypothetical protein ILYODFUR_037537, partial [Ilyodon furcidens]
ALKKMVEEKYEKTKQNAKEDTQKMSAVSFTADMRTSINMEVYLAITCHLMCPQLVWIPICVHFSFHINTIFHRTMSGPEKGWFLGTGSDP